MPLEHLGNHLRTWTASQISSSTVSVSIRASNFTPGNSRSRLRFLVAVNRLRLLLRLLIASYSCSLMQFILLSARVDRDCFARLAQRFTFQQRATERARNKSLRTYARCSSGMAKRNPRVSLLIKRPTPDLCVISLRRIILSMRSLMT